MSDDEDYDLCNIKGHNPKRRRLNDSHIQDNHKKILELIKNQQKMIDDFTKTIKKLNSKVKESNNKIYELEETVRKQQLSMSEYMPAIFKTPPSYFY